MTGEALTSAAHSIRSRSMDSPPNPELPPHLRFVHDLRFCRKDEIPEDYAVFMGEQIRLLKQHRIELTAHGVNVAGLLAAYEPYYDELVAMNSRVEELQEEMLHACADSAEAQLDVFRSMKQLLKAAEETKPFDPATQNLRELVEEWRDQFPKE